MKRITYKSQTGDYGSTKIFKNEYEEICILRNALGKYEDLGYTAEELKEIIQKTKE